MRQVVTISARPDLVTLIAGWRVGAFSAGSGMTAERLAALILDPPPGPHETFVALDGETPVGTAAIVAADLASRPDLTPWLAGVFVPREHRGRGHATALVQAAEHHAARAGVQTLWLYTWTAEPLYAGLGWERSGMEMEGNRPVALMRRMVGPG